MNASVEISELIEQVRSLNTKFIVVTGGVCSSIGKGVLISSLGVLLKNAGYSVSIIKWDPYLNVDPGTMSPLVHGEVFVTSDGAETDLDLGHYERFVELNLKRDSSVSSGQIYKEILDGEREGRFLGKCIQMIPHVVNILKRRLLEFALNHKVQFVLVEIGGTVGDMEGGVFLEAIRQFRMELGASYIMHAHLSLVPFLNWTGEIKTKPTQHSVMELKRAGLAPDCLFLRADKKIEDQAINKLSVMCEVKQDYIFQVLSCEPIYKVFLDLDSQEVSRKIQNYFNFPLIKKSDLGEWQRIIERIGTSKKRLLIGLIAKYVGSNDPYISVIEAIKSAAHHSSCSVNLVIIEAELLEKDVNNKDISVAWQQLRSLDGIVVPGGFDSRGIEGKILAAQWAREQNIPYLGLCLGMQVMIIEISRSLLHFDQANSTEFAPKTNYPVVCMMSEQQNITHKGASMRLGSYACTVVEDTKAYKAYNKKIVSERHRHRYEVNNIYKDALESVGVVFSGICQDMNLVEIAELKAHSFMVAVQFHPEFQSSALNAHPLIKMFVAAVDKKFTDAQSL